jgi:two-component system, chemotaxis family, sensor kinase CheA
MRKGTDPEMQAVLREELSGLFDELLALLDQFEDGEIQPVDLVRRGFRIYHNAKGALRIGGHSRLELLAHLIEDQLSALRDGRTQPSPELLRLIRDSFAAIVQELESGRESAAVDELIGELGRMAAVVAAAPAAPAPTEEPDEGDHPQDAPAVSAPPPKPAASSRPATSLRDAIRIDARRLDRVMGLGSEYLAQHSRQSSRQAALREVTDRLASISRRTAGLRDVVWPVIRDLEGLLRAEERELRRGAQLSADFDQAMREVRMQPLSSTAAHYRRVVLETARGLGKEVHVRLDLGDVELDRQVLDALREPVMHLLRNAVDHGLEPPAERKAAGKPVRGEVAVRARLRGTMVELDVADDGRGVDRARVLAKGMALSLVTAEAAPADLDELLFAPGFSTASSVSAVSGRGVGLDVVRARVAELGGQVGLVRDDLVGARFRITVPTSVVSLQGLSVRAGSANFVLPSSHVERTLRVKAQAVKSAEGAALVSTPEGEPLRLRWLSTAMGQPRSDDATTLHVVVVNEGQHRHGLVVDEVRGDTSFVIKRLPWNVRRTRGVIGATHQGDASLALVVDVPLLFRARTSGRDQEHKLQIAPRKRTRRILVVDDSLTSRTLERNILSDAGYEVETVVDGNAAWRALEGSEFDLVVSDVQMPGMDGLELTRRVRASAKHAELPIILVTSLDRPEDVSAGAQAGANDYIVKGRFDQQALLETVSRLV